MYRLGFLVLVIFVDGLYHGIHQHQIPPFVGECFWFTFSRHQTEAISKYIDILIYLRSTPHPVTVTTRIITFLVGDPYKPPFVTVTGWGVDLRYSHISYYVSFFFLWSFHFQFFKAPVWRVFEVQR